MDSKHNWQAEDSLYQKIVEKFGEDVLADDALFHRAELYENKLKDPAKAMELYQDLLTKYPGSLFVGRCLELNWFGFKKRKHSL